MITRTNYLLVLIAITIFQLQVCGQNKQKQEKLVRESTIAFNAGHYTNALNGFDKLISLDSADYASWAFRARTLYFLKRDDEALFAFNKAIAINPKYYECYSYRATFYSLNGQFELAIKDINMALIGKKDDTKLLETRAGYFLRSNKFDNAISDCNYLLQLDPKNAKILYFRGIALKKTGNIEKALADFNNSIEINPNNAEIHNDRGFVFIAQEKYNLAITDFTKSIQLTETKDTAGKAYSYNNLGFCQYKNGDLEQALKDVNYSIKLLPTNPYAYRNRALIFLEMKKKAEACADIELSLQLGFTKNFGNEVIKLQTKNCK